MKKMTKKFWIMGAVILILALAAGTITAQSIWESRVDNQQEKEMEEEVEAPAECPEPEEALKEEGIITGRIDSHSVEMEVNGKLQAFGLHEELREQEFVEDVPVEFEYYLDENERPILTWVRLLEEEKKGAEDKKDTPDGEKDREETNLRKGEGILTGWIDSHSVEIKVKGKPQAFALSEKMRDKKFAPGNISFKYYVDDQGRSVITQADFQKPRDAEVHTAEGIFRGKADSHTMEIEIEGKPRAFGVEKNLSFTGINPGQELFIAYQEDDRGREVIIKIEKIL